MPSRRAALSVLGVAVAGCVGPSASPTTSSRTASSRTASSATPSSPTEATDDGKELPPVPTPSDDALQRWCAPAAGVAASRLSVLGEALGADESTVRVGFTGDGELRPDAPAVVLAGVVDEANVGEHAYISAVELTEGRLTVAIEPGYPTETGTETQVGMAMGVRYTAEITLENGFPEAVIVRHHGDRVARVAGPC